MPPPEEHHHMAPRTKAPQLVQQYVTGGDRSLREWHLMLRRVTFGAGLALMFASVYSLHWAMNLIGLTGYAEPIAWLVPLAIEVGMAATASTATTIRKDTGGYYLHLWVIFSFLMALAQMANIGHAIDAVAATGGGSIGDVLPPVAVYVFACSIAALFPLGGTLFVHVSGFLRANGVGARWIEEDAEVVHVQAAPSSSQTAAPRAPRTPAPTAAHREPAPAPARTPQAPPRAPAPTPEATRAPTPRTAGDPLKDAARALFDEAIATDPMTKPDAKVIHDTIGSTKNPATTRRWVADWYAEHEVNLGIHRPDLTPADATPTPAPAGAEPAENGEAVA